MTINILTPKQVRAVRHTGPRSHNNVYHMFIRPIMEDHVPGISFHYKDAGYASSQSAYKAVKTCIDRGYKGCVEVATRGEVVYVYAISLNEKPDEKEPDGNDDWDL